MKKEEWVCVCVCGCVCEVSWIIQGGFKSANVANRCVCLCTRVCFCLREMGTCVSGQALAWRVGPFSTFMSIRGEDWPSNEHTLRDIQVFAISQEKTSVQKKWEGRRPFWKRLRKLCISAASCCARDWRNAWELSSWWCVFFPNYESLFCDLSKLRSSLLRVVLYL